MAKVLGKTGSPIKSWAMMYKALVQALLLHVREIWVVTDAMIMDLYGFHHRTARRIAGITAKKGDGGKWEWDLVDTELENTEIFMIKEYRRRRQNKIVEYIAWRPIYKICTGAERMEGSSMFLRWCDQYHVPNQRERDL